MLPFQGTSEFDKGRHYSLAPSEDPHTTQIASLSYVVPDSEKAAFGAALKSEIEKTAQAKAAQAKAKED
jgi:hypothetical protein